MHRFHLPPDQCQGKELILSDREAHHALHVLRLRPRDPVVVLDGAGTAYQCRVQALERGNVRLTVGSSSSTPPVRCALTLIQALPKGKIFESILHRAIELGVHRVVPLLSARVVVHLEQGQREQKLAHWRATAIEAIKQCGALWLPLLDLPATLTEFLDRREQFDLALVASLQPDSRHPREWFLASRAAQKVPPRTVAMWIGPEGDFTPDELAAIRSTGARPITLGPHVLRVETAATYCLSVLSYELQTDLT
ncbi:MAG TPA: RsmE family RNA methyltransferase [Candidatus Dormibacteraeota bacterium]|nr:RsmE family RNA methyltransferase [Verrucomicrobiae bacterium]HXJ72715.1 RsmE family RNA methyltransferase [Candidatus Dormibacteraeota bacterium]